MNEQKAPHGIEWTRIVNPDGTRRRGFTWNPIGGCLHDCYWAMPDGTVAECYAKTVAERVALKAYPQGFAHSYWHPERLKEPTRMQDGAGIFPDSMSDLFGAWVPADQITQILDVMRATPQHIYQSLTKNAPGYRKFAGQLPANLWAGVSSPPDQMLGKTLTAIQKDRYLFTALEVLAELRRWGRTTWMSFEPLSQDWTDIVAAQPDALSWAVIGAASAGRQYFPPEERAVRRLLDVLDDHGVPVFFKGNMRSLPYAAAHWREDFPKG